ncbi:PREDICTED: calmodulin-A-like [Branchiostoma belcheri]|uniref:Calmodulin-A-like n=1 Tax=Branchiostoma belcheri TaxID=7741 RepID=A0A6P4ZHZ1_BRABE|nr:PREDICTED: calmodulin-A-like [Branchiostoma belcheri]
MWKTAKKVLPPINAREKSEEKLEEIFDLSAEQIAEYREAFSVYQDSTDSTGTVTVDRLGKVLESVGEKCTNDELTDLLERADLRMCEKIDFREFLTMMQKRKEETDASDVISEAFMLFDTNGDGYLGAEELRHVMTCLGEQLTDEDVENMVRLADMDGDGKINFAEFATMMSSDQ